MTQTKREAILAFGHARRLDLMDGVVTESELRDLGWQPDVITGDWLKPEWAGRARLGASPTDAVDCPEASAWVMDELSRRGYSHQVGNYGARIAFPEPLKRPSYPTVYSQFMPYDRSEHSGSFVSSRDIYALRCLMVDAIECAAGCCTALLWREPPQFLRCVDGRWQCYARVGWMLEGCSVVEADAE